MAARVEQPIDQAASDQPAPAPKSTKQKSDFDQLPSASSLGANRAQYHYPSAALLRRRRSRRQRQRSRGPRRGDTEQPLPPSWSRLPSLALG